MLIILFISGLLILSLGAEIFVRGASRLASMMGISPLIIGLTVAAFGTSAPEVAVVVRAGFEGQGELAFGNIIGSNISNFLLILGLSSIAAPLVVSKRLYNLEIPLLLGITSIVLVLGFNGNISSFEGILLLFGSAFYTLFVIWKCRKEGRAKDEKKKNLNVKQEKRSADIERSLFIRKAWKPLLLIAAGLVGLILGAGWLVDSASEIARFFGVSELIIGLSIVAIGTSLPELATAVAAGLRGERDLAIGNVVGSNLFNLLFVLGVGAVTVPGGIPVPPSSISFDIPVLLAVTAACLPIFFTEYKIDRLEGILFLSCYAAYLFYLFLFSTQHDLLPAFSTLMVRYILPPTALLLLLFMMRARILSESEKGS
jgi:cation:H+ antiporter